MVQKSSAHTSLAYSELFTVELYKEKNTMITFIRAP